VVLAIDIIVVVLPDTLTGTSVAPVLVPTDPVVRFRGAVGYTRGVAETLNRIQFRIKPALRWASTSARQKDLDLFRTTCENSRFCLLGLFLCLGMTRVFWPCDLESLTRNPLSHPLASSPKSWAIVSLEGNFAPSPSSPYMERWR